MTTYRLTVEKPEDYGRLVMDLGNMQHPFTVTAVQGKDRTPAQNRTIHKWFGEIAAQRGDVTAEEVKAECNLQYGRPILARDDAQWDAAFRYVFEGLGYAAKLKAIRVFDIPFTRRMTTAQLTEYMDAMAQDYRSRGIVLTDPDARKYEGAA